MLCPRLGGRRLPWAFCCFTIVPGWAHSLSPDFAWWVSAIEASERRRSRPLPDEHAPSASPGPNRPPSPPDVRKPYRWDRGRKLTAAEVSAAVERAIARSDKR